MGSSGEHSLPNILESRPSQWWIHYISDPNSLNIHTAIMGRVPLSLSSLHWTAQTYGSSAEGSAGGRVSSPVTRAVGLLSGMGVRNPPVLCNLIAPAQPGSHLPVAHPHGHHAPDLLLKVSHALCICTLLPVPQVLPAFSVTADQLCPQETSEGCHLAGARVTSPGMLASQPWGWVFCRVCPLRVLSFYPTVNSNISLYLTATFWSCFNN